MTKENMVDFRIRDQENKEINQILAETSEGKSILMNVAKKIKFNDRIGQISKGLQWISGSAYLGSFYTSFAMTLQGNANGKYAAAGIPIAAVVFALSTYAKWESEKKATDISIMNDTKKTLKNEEKKLLEDAGKKVYPDKDYHTIITAARDFTRTVKNLQKEKLQQEGNLERS